MKIGLSYDGGTPEYRQYVGALMAAADQTGIDVQPTWLAGTHRELDEAVARTMDGLMLTGGADVDGRRYGIESALIQADPARDAIEWTILDAAFARRVPILALCRGMQLLNVYRGGTLFPDLGEGNARHKLDEHGRHEITAEPGSALIVLAGTTTGNVPSTHHQAVDALGRGLTISARAADGTIEGLEWAYPMRKPWLAAVQWHPEQMNLDEPFSGALFRGFLQAVAVSHNLS